MADMKIEDATLDTQVTGAELLPASDGGTAKAVSAAKIKDYVIGQLADVATESALDTANDGVYVKRGNAVKRVSAGVLAAAVLDYAFALTGIVDINGNEKIALKDSNTKKSATLADLKTWVLNGLADTTGETPVSGAERIAALESAMGNKVDKVSGKGLSTQDFTTEDKQKLDALVSNMQPDWNQTDSTKGDFIKNKPSMSFASEIWPEWDEDDANDYVVGYRVSHEGKFYEALVSMVGDTVAQPVTNSLYWKQITVGEVIDGKVDVVDGKGLSANDYTTAEKTKLSGIETGAEVNTIRAIKLYGEQIEPDQNGAVDIWSARNLNVVWNMSDVPNDGEEGHPTGELLFAHLPTGYQGVFLNDVWINWGDETACKFRHVEVSDVDPDTYYHPEQQNG